MVDTSALEALGSGTGTYEAIGSLLGVSSTAVIAILAIISIWTLVWKGFALWKSAQKKSIPWFIILLIFNTVGILEILYIFIFSKISFRNKKFSFEKSKKKK
tara:strand:+ start:96 stop:401 length:306 start_codon:yes stop_codon:yes gene_type:complete